MSRPPHLDSLINGTYKETHGTPKYILDVVREMYGDISHDLASSDRANYTVRAVYYYTAENPCPRYPEVNGDIDRVFCNPPGPIAKVRYFWDVWTYCIGEGATGAFLFFSADHMKTAKFPLGKWTVCFLKRRVKYIGNKHGAPMPSAMVFPGHTNEPERLGLGNCFYRG